MDSQKNKIFMIFSNKKKKLGFTPNELFDFNKDHVLIMDETQKLFSNYKRFKISKKLMKLIFLR